MKMWLLIVKALSGECEFVIRAETRPDFEEVWTTDEHVYEYRWVELKTSRTTEKYTLWLL